MLKTQHDLTNPTEEIAMVDESGYESGYEPDTDADVTDTDADDAKALTDAAAALRAAGYTDDADKAARAAGTITDAGRPATVNDEIIAALTSIYNALTTVARDLHAFAETQLTPTGYTAAGGKAKKDAGDVGLAAANADFALTDADADLPALNLASAAEALVTANAALGALPANFVAERRRMEEID
jgi:hypothetical protein